MFACAQGQVVLSNALSVALSAGFWVSSCAGAYTN
jgi:hypothetical protein